MIRRRVDLPVPFRPTRATFSPRSTRKDAPVRISSGPNDLRTPTRESSTVRKQFTGRVRLFLSERPLRDEEAQAPRGEAPTTSEPASLWKRPKVVRLLLVALLAEIGYAALNLSTMPVYLKEDRKFGESVIGLVLTAFLFSEAVFKTPMGSLADRIGSKRLMVLGPSLSVATALLSLLVPHTNAGVGEVGAFVLLRSLDGVGIAMLWPAAFAQMNALVEDERRQQAMSLLNLCYMVGIAFAFPIGGIANDLSGNTWAGLVLAAAVFGGVAFTAFRIIPSRRAALASHAPEAEEGLGVLLGSLRQIPKYLLLSVVTFMGIGFPTYIFKLFPIDQFGFSETKVGMLILPGAIALAVGSVPMSRLGERLGRVRAVHVGLLTSAIGMGVIASGAILPFMRSPVVLALGGIPAGIGFLLAIPAWMASVSDIDPRRRGSNLGAVMTAQGL
ncbi:MAG: hypothetical protein C4320_00815, partial [Armatimonadota bacterium]